MIPAKYDLETLHRGAQTALECSDAVWYHSTLKSDLCGCRLSSEEESKVIDGAMQTAANMAQRVAAQYGQLSPQELLEAMNIKLVYTAEELREPYLYMGLYEPAIRTITLNDSPILLIRQFIRETGLAVFTPEEDIIRVALLHEIFHALEEETPDIYTRSGMLERKLLGIFPYKRGLSGVSEVGAVHFSKCMAGVSYSPCIYERYLLMALNLLSIDFLPPNV
ncbi:hypothetical protein [Sporomusa sp.]|uniref:hypothetical protein n=1 Tax=Sporomusa sp. TaxID=2078658 RepID=UPI002C4FC1FD|nr:hypothetical protein [Sporomusa sp.]HWR42960.1 hypothetical protein [Sporomusa sp.]